MQSKNKNVRNELPARYRRYCEFKRHLRERSGGEVFPFGESSEQTINKETGSIQANCLTATCYKGAGNDGMTLLKLNNPANKRQNGRRFKEDGEPSFTLTAQDRHGVMIKEATKKGYAVAYKGDSINLSVPNSKTRRGRVGVGVGVAQTLDTGMQQHTLQECRIRRLTPMECERLQGFPEVEKCDIIEVCKENQKKNVNAENLNHKSQKLVGSAERKDSQKNVKYVVKFLNTKNQQINKLVQRNVLINCEESGIEIYSQGKLLLNAKFAEKKNWCHQYIKIEDFVQMLVGINSILEKITNFGKAVYAQNEKYLALQKSGKRLEKLFGKEITQPVGDVEKDLIILKELLKSITLDHLDTGSLEQKLATLSSFVIRAIIGYIPMEIKNQSTFTITIKNKVGWTYGCSDTQRYRQCGNAVSCPVITAIIKKLINNYGE